MLQCIDSIQYVDPLPENSFQSVKADFVQNFSDFRKKFICRPELLSLEIVLEMLEQETSRGAKSG
jgi:hypothetical protein